MMMFINQSVNKLYVKLVAFEKISGVHQIRVTYFPGHMRTVAISISFFIDVHLPQSAFETGRYLFIMIKITIKIKMRHVSTSVFYGRF